jgi:hypothetical protein
VARILPLEGRTERVRGRELEREERAPVLRRVGGAEELQEGAGGGAERGGGARRHHQQEQPLPMLGQLQAVGQAGEDGGAGGGLEGGQGLLRRLPWHGFVTLGGGQGRDTRPPSAAAAAAAVAQAAQCIPTMVVLLLLLLLLFPPLLPPALLLSVAQTPVASTGATLERPAADPREDARALQG